MDTNNDRIQRVSQLVVLFCATSTAMIGTGALLGWILDIPILATYGAGQVPMAPTTSILLILFGISLIHSTLFHEHSSGTRLATICSILIIGGSALLVGVQLMGVRPLLQLMGPAMGKDLANVPVGMMSPMTALCLVLSAGGFLMIHTRVVEVHARMRIGLALASVVLFISFTLLLPYCFGVPLFYSHGVVPPALPTLLGLLLISAGILVKAVQQRESPGLVFEEFGTGTVLSFVIFFGLVCTGILMGGYTYYRSIEREYTEEQQNELAATGLMKANEIIEYRKERLGDASTFYRNETFSALVRTFLKTPKGSPAGATLREWLDHYRTSYIYDRISIFDAAGTERLAVPETSGAGSQALGRILTQQPQAGLIRFQDCYRDSTDYKIYMALIVPVFTTQKASTIAGFVVLRIDAEETIFSIIRQWPVPSSSSEVILTHREGNATVCLNDVRFAPHTALALQSPLRRDTISGQSTPFGLSGIIHGIDYRGRLVVAYGQNIPDSPWYLLAQTSTEEMFATLRNAGTILFILVGALLGGTATGFALVLRTARGRYFRQKYESSEALRRAEQQLNLMYENAPVAYQSLDRNAHILEVNQAWLDQLGYQRGEVIGHFIGEFLFPEDAGFIQQQFAKFMTNGEMHNGSLRFRHKDGQSVHILFEGRVSQHPDGSFKQTHCVLHNITDMRQAEESLREAEERFRNVFEHAAVGKSITHISGELRTNQVFCTMLGYTNEELQNVQWKEITHPDDIAADVKYLESIIAGTNSMEHWEKRYIHKNGSIITVDLSTYLQRTPEGLPEYFITTVFDITGRKKIERELLRLNRIYAVLSKINEAIVRIDDRQELFNAVCRIGVNEGGFRMAWVASLNPESGQVEVVAAAGHIDGYLDSININLNDPARNAGPICRALKTGLHQLSADISTNAMMGPWQEQAIHRGYRSCISLPLTVGGRVPYAITFYSGEPGFFDDSEMHLPDELAMDIGFALEVQEQTKAQQEAERALLESKRFLGNIVDNLQALLSVTNLDGEYVLVNRKFEEISGRNRNQLLGRTRADFLPKEVTERHRANEIAVITSKLPVVTEEDIAQPDGLHHYIVMQFPLVDNNGEVFAVGATATDVTAIKQAEAEARASEFRLKLAQRIANIGHYTVDIQAGTATISDMLDEMFGMDGDFKPTLHDWFNLIHPEDRLRAQQMMAEKVIRDHQQLDLEYRIIRRSDHEVRWVHDLANLELSETGQPLRLFGVVQDITERKQAEEAFLQNDLRLNQSQRIANLGHFTVDVASAGIWESSESLDHIFGIDSSFIRDMQGWIQIAHPEDREEVRKYMREATFENLSQIDRTFRIQRVSDNVVRWVHEIARLERNSNGKLERIFGVIQDITERKQAEATLLENDLRLKQSQRIANLGHFTVDIISGNWEGSESLDHIFGIDDSYARDMRGWVQVIHSEDRKEVKGFIKQAMSSAASHHDQTFRIVRASDQAVRWVHEIGRYERDSNGRLVRIFGVIQDITEQKFAEESLIRLNTAVQSSGEVIIMANLEGIITFVNPAFTKFFGYTADEVIGKATPRILDSDNMDPEFDAQFWNAIRNKQVFRAELKNRAKDGRLVPVELSANPIISSTGEVVGFLAVQRDITDRLEAQEQLARLQDDLFQAQKMESIGTLAAGIAHDFNNILGIILGYTDILRMKDTLPILREQAVNTISGAVERGAGLVRQILTFARQSGISVGPLDLNILVKEMAKMFAETFPRSIVVETRVDRAIPNIPADASQMHQVLLNLAVNARDAMPDGGTLTFTTSIRDGELVLAQFPDATDETYMELTVTDTGEGMSEEVVTHIFEPFYTTKSKGKGTGLGLAVVYGVVKGHGGFINVESTPGTGTTFHLYFPAHEAEAVVSSPVPQAGPSSSGRGEHVLLVEDELHLAHLLTSLLESRGYRVTHFDDGQAAIEYYAHHAQEIELVFSDMGLPGVSGREIFNFVRAVNPTARFIMASGFITPEDRAELSDAGVTAILDKPYKAEVVCQTVHDVLTK